MEIKKMRQGRIHVEPQKDTSLADIGLVDTKAEQLGIGKVLLASELDNNGNPMDIKTGDTIIFSIGATAKVPTKEGIIHVLNERDAFAIL